MPKISVLFPTYNTKEEYLREAIESVLNQTFSDFEFIVLDDCSPDPNVEKVVKSYTDPRIRFYRNERNLGISATRNKLIDLASGEYLAVMDHDDVSLPERFEKEAAYLDAHPDVGLVSCQAERFPHGKNMQVCTNDKDIKLAMMRICPIVHSACMIRKSVLVDNNIHYEEEFSPSEDHALFIRLMKVTKFHNLPEVLFRYRWHADNTSHKQRDKMRAATFALQALVKTEHPALYNEFLLRATHVSRVRLFGFVPIFKIETRGYKTKLYLFEKLLLLSFKSSVKLREGQ